MEVREILVMNTRTQKRVKVNTAATTLGELKAALDEKGMDYEGLTFTEGISNTTLNDDASLLPTNVRFLPEGASEPILTNNLIILLTNTKKNVASGSGTRADAYQIIYEEGLQEDIKDYFEKPFTCCKTEDLWEFINNNIETEDTEDTEECDNGCCPEEEEKDPHAFARDFGSMLESLIEVDKADLEDVIIIKTKVDEIYNTLTSKNTTIDLGGHTVSDADLDKMMSKL